MQQLLGVSAAHRSCEQVALAERTSNIAERVELPAILNPFGDDGHAERVTELDSRADDRYPGALLDRLDQRAIELDEIMREALEAAQRGVARAEIVERDAHAQRAQAGNNRLDAGVQDEALGDLQYKRAGSMRCP